jgi:hypothetical protein
MSAVAWVDASAGCSGDMFLGALVDLGLPLAVLEEVVDRLGLEGIELHVQRVARGPLSATKVDVCRDGVPIAGRDDVHLAREDRDAGRLAHLPPTGRAPEGHAHPHEHEPTHDHAPTRSLAEVLDILARAGDLGAPPFSWAAAAFRALARAEGRVHGLPAGEVRFHEVGAADALVDVAGTCAGLHHLGVEEVHVAPLPWGQGTVSTQHGLLALPAPATGLLLEGHPVVPSRETFEQVTPTGAALVRALARGSSPPPGFVPRRTGFGAGTREVSSLPNVVRLVLGDVASHAATEEVVLLETNLDDASGQVVAYALERALAQGALDAWHAPVTMKKGRPGVVLSVLARPQDAGALEALLFRETPTLGIRRRVFARSVLVRRRETVETPWGRVGVKVRQGPDGPAATPEYEDCRALAERHDVPLSEILAAARAAWRALERD